jgi:hypothetical protein
MVHLVVKPYDPSLDYEGFAKQAFGDKPCLLMLEKKGGDHLHIQGMTDLSEEAFRKLQSNELTLKHYRKREDPGCHPVKKRRQEADENGFQYMCKELDTSVVVYKQVFTDDELESLHAASNHQRDILKSQLGEYIAGSGYIRSTDPPEIMHNCVCLAAIEYYMVEDKMQPPNLRLLCRHILLKYWGTQAVKEYVAKLLM